MHSDKELIELAGTVKSIIYQNEENGYTVLKMENTDGEDFNAVGCLPFSARGEHLILFGDWTRHPSHGMQFSIQFAERVMPTSKEAIYDYLASRTVKGIGPATATLIVNKFGEKTFEVLERTPDRLAEIRGISIKKARQISESYKKQAGMRRLIEFLYVNGLQAQLAVRLYRFYGDGATALLEQNPFIICSEHIGGKFSDADSLAINLGMEGTSPQRVAAAIVFELMHNLRNGHCFIPKDKLAYATTSLIEVDPALVDEQMEYLIENKEIINETVAGVSACYLNTLYNAERHSAEKLLQMKNTPAESYPKIDEFLENLQAEEGINYAQLQIDTIKTAETQRVMALTGGPGTGKTTCIKAILRLFDEMEIETLLAAPTGRAAKRMSELTGRQAHTVHRLLEAQFDTNDGVVFRRNEGDPLKCDALILDECSMVDILLMRAVLRALPPNCRLILVGDADQLPSVGAGNVFLDIIRSNVIKTVRLTEIFRQSEESYIVRNAHMINRGEHPKLSENKNGFFFLRRPEADQAIETLVELCTKRLPEKMQIPTKDIQVLSPTRRGEQGTVNLNRMLQEAINPPHPKKKERKLGEIIFREGDRVMQIRNNYDITWFREDETEEGAGIFNGDIGFITAINLQEENILIDYDGKIAQYEFDMLIELEHAYAMTVHKSQGSEYRAVVFSAGKGSTMLLSRSILYTAITRARELLISVGDDEVMHYMIDNHRITRRYSGLRARLCGEVL